MILPDSTVKVLAPSAGYRPRVEVKHVLSSPRSPSLPPPLRKMNIIAFKNLKNGFIVREITRILSKGTINGFLGSSSSYISLFTL